MEMIKTNSREYAGSDSDTESPNVPTEIHLPDIPSAFGYLLGHFFLSGQVIQSGHGLVPLTWQELKAYIEVNELELCVWEIQILKKMSDAYCAEYSRASDPKRPAPYNPVVEEAEVDQIAKALRIMQGLSALKTVKV